MKAVPSHYVVLGDLIQSRRIPNRRAASEHLRDALLDVARNWIPQEAWLAEPKTIKGMDEIAGVLRTSEYSFDFLTYLNQQIWPHRIRVVVADGDIDVGLDRPSRDVSAMDGPAFHRAANGMRRAKLRGLPFVLETANSDRDPVTRDLIENSARIHHALVSEWTETSRRRAVALIGALAKNRPRSQKELAQDEGVSEQAYSSSLRQAHAKELYALQGSIRAFLRQWSA